MRELNAKEIDQVGGGLVPWAGAAAGGFAVGAFTGGATAYLSGGSWQDVAASSILGGISGGAGGIAAVTSGAAKALNTLRSVGYGIASGTVIGSSPSTGDIGDKEKALEK